MIAGGVRVVRLHVIGAPVVVANGIVCPRPRFGVTVAAELTGTAMFPSFGEDDRYHRPPIFAKKRPPPPRWAICGFADASESDPTTVPSGISFRDQLP